MPSNISKYNPQPFINWVGGKRKIAEQLIPYIPSGLNNYYEPFLGGGALFFAIYGRFKKYFLSDINLELVTSYNAVKKNLNEINGLVNTHIKNHSKEYYYQIRDCNNSNNPSIISSRFIYLNRYAFKGIYRINMNGKSGVHFSTKKYTLHSIDEKLKQSSNFLQKAMIFSNDFSFIEPKANDFVYFDPPYHQAGERFYTRLPFDEKEQIRLRDFAGKLTNKKVKWLISNSDTPFIRNLYQNYNINSIEVKYSIHEQKKTSRELVITNF